MGRNRRSMRSNRPRKPVTPGAPRIDFWRWPLVKAFVPSPEPWRVSGYGSAGVIRRQPDGRCASAFFTFSVMHVGIETMFGQDDKPAEEIERGLREYGHLMPPCEEGPEDLVSRFVWGAYGLSLWGDVEWEPDKVGRYLRMVPPLSGTRNWWFQQFVGENGLVPPELWEHVQPLITVADRSPQGKEPAVATFMTYAGVDGDAAAQALRSRPDVFTESTGGGGGHPPTFFWMRERRAEPGRKVKHGAVVVGATTIQAHAATLSLASIMVGVMKDALGPELRLTDASWSDPSKLGFDPPGRMIV
jgi:hypothetical protein